MLLFTFPSCWRLGSRDGRRERLLPFLHQGRDSLLQVGGREGLKSGPRDVVSFCGGAVVGENSEFISLVSRMTERRRIKGKSNMSWQECILDRSIIARVRWRRGIR